MDTCSYDIPLDDTLQDGMDIEWQIKKGVPFRGLERTEYNCHTCHIYIVLVRVPIKNNEAESGI